MLLWKLLWTCYRYVIHLSIRSCEISDLIGRYYIVTYSENVCRTFKLLRHIKLLWSSCVEATWLYSISLLEARNVFCGEHVHKNRFLRWSLNCFFFCISACAKVDILCNCKSCKQIFLAQISCSLFKCCHKLNFVYNVVDGERLLSC